MGKLVNAAGSQLPELVARHNSTIPFVHGLNWQFFRKTKVDKAKKLGVASSLLLSKELFGAGAIPGLSATERQRLHCNVMAVYRKALCGDARGDNFEDPRVAQSDADLLRAHGVRSPMAYFRFARLGLSIRVAAKAPP